MGRKTSGGLLFRRRWGESESEKDSVNLFPGEPTDDAIYGEETLNLGFKGLIGIKKKDPDDTSSKSFFFMQEMGLEPTQGCPRQILSLMRLPFRHSCVSGVLCTPNDLFII